MSKVLILDAKTGPAFMDAMCAGATPTQAQLARELGYPKPTGDLEADRLAIFRHIDAQFAKAAR